MQRAEESSSRAIQPERSGLKPTTAFLLLLSGAVAVAGVLYLTSPEPAPSPTTTTTTTKPNFALTDSEAITRFEELNDLRLQMYAQRDASLIDAFLSSDSKLRRRASAEVSQLLADKVVPVTDFTNESVTVLVNSPHRIVVRQVELDRSRFESETGRDLTKGPGVIRRTIDWTLRLEGSEWLLFSAKEVSSEVVRK